MRALKAISFTYEARQDRILVVVNPDTPQIWSGWLTRRMGVLMLDRTATLLADNSKTLPFASPNSHRAIEAFKRETALAATEAAMTSTAAAVLVRLARMATLVEQITIYPQGDRFRLGIRGADGEGTSGLLTNIELQRVVHMIEREAIRAHWLGHPSEAQSKLHLMPTDQKPVRH